MNIYWTFKSFPELRDLEPSRRKVVWRACCLRPFLHWQTWAAFLGQSVFAASGAILGAFIDGWHQIWFTYFSGGSLETHQYDQLSLPIYTGLLFWLAGTVGAFVFGQVYSRMIRPYLKKYVESHDPA
jgi:hypothetical protein